ncbi:VWA domain-containing protein [Lignipirellula cremea]|uniref:von Willebrand factor type A domain protein n=1 Tax=Lignipirellula cremea TaxID=2528010 RepID=A0A518E4V6_9BACT|nr:VWA domain-containing protein [Lignipirellula cremea]QDU99103.1 von Willebrand factor type A domain protein [Lignipirellula cremea]
MDIQFGNFTALHLLWVVAAVMVVVLFAMAARRRALARFATSNLVGRLALAGNRGRQWIKAILATAALALMVVSLLDIRWGKAWRETPQKGIEVMFVLDVSRSMLAEDVAPNRLDRAKRQIGDMVEAMAGDRVGLVAFAGTARRLVPLTSHYHDFQQTLQSAGPLDVDRGGSRLGDALKLASEGFLDQTGDHKAIVVFTDGEDQESKPVETAEQLHRDHGIRIFTVGLGDFEQGARIPVQQGNRGRSYMEYEGQQVWSKMNGATLEQVALAADGAYIPAGVKQVDMGQVYHRYVSQVEQRDFETARIHSYLPRFQWFVGLALLLLTIDTLLPAVRRRRETSGGASPSLATAASTSSRNKAAAATSLAMLLLLPQIGSAAEPADLVRKANQALHAGEFDQAMADYQQAAESDPNRPELLYNQAVVQYRQGQYDQARQLFAQATATADSALDAKARYNLANCDYAEAVQLATSDKPAAIERLQSAIPQYRAALQGDPTDTDARANLQLAQLLINQLQQEEEQEQQDEQQKDDQQKDDQQQDDQQKDDQQKDDQQQDGQQQDDQQQDGQQQDGQQQDGQQQDDQQQDGQQQDGQQQDDQQQDGQQQDDQQNDGQQQDGQQKSEDEPQEPSDQQGQPSPDGEEANDPAQQPPAGGQPGEASPDDQGEELPAFDNTRSMTKEEAQKMLQAVRDRELLRHLQQQRQTQRQRLPVDRDW